MACTKIADRDRITIVDSFLAIDGHDNAYTVLVRRVPLDASASPLTPSVALPTAFIDFRTLDGRDVEEVDKAAGLFLIVGSGVLILRVSSCPLWGW